MDADVAIVGAGMAGIRCAQVLTEAGRSVQVFDKGRKPGGRMSTRRAADTTFDHGAQFFTAKDPAFGAVVDTWAEAGWVAPWTGRVVEADAEGVRPRTVEETRWVGVPTMSALPRALAEGLPITCSRRVGTLARVERGWSLTDEHGEAMGTFGHVVVNAPAGQAVPLLADAPSLAAQAEASVMHPCWAVMIVPEAFEAPFDAAHVSDSALAWVARQPSKPGRNDVGGWMLHATGAWTQAQWETSAETVVEVLVNELGRIAGTAVGSLAHAKAHRWRYALADAPLPEQCLWDPQLRVGACGDWCGGPRVEGAYRSGERLAAKILAV
ncbi:MAG: FAD-dependent oxidoreductase [Myxococcota bacterium]